MSDEPGPAPSADVARGRPRNPRLSDAGVASDLLRELIAMHAKVLTRLPVVQLLLALGIAAIVRKQVPASLLVQWMLLTVGWECVRAVVGWRLLRIRDTLDPPRTERLLAALAAVAGLTDGLVAVLFFPSVDILDQAVLGTILFAIPAAGATVSMSSRMIIGAFAIPVIGAACWMWGSLHPDHLWPVMMLGVLYCTLMVIVTGEHERLLRRAVAIRHERDEALADLKLSHAEAREAMRRAEREAQSRARVLASASHDLRQPLHALSVYSAILAEHPDPQTTAEVGRYVHEIVRSLGDVLNGLLDLSKLSAEQYAPDVRVFDLGGLCRQVCAEFLPAARDKGLRLEMRLPFIDIQGDVSAWRRIARNLIDNAIKYTDRGSVEIELSRADDRVRLHVRDSGRGIAAEFQQRIFEEFFQLDNPGRDRSRGVGLGLAIVQRLCALNHLGIMLRSIPGAGSEFIIDAPYQRVEQPADDTDLGVQAPPHVAGRTVWILDDEPPVRESMLRLMRLWGVDARAFATAAELASQCETGELPQLLITDLRLGEAPGGAELVRRLQARHGRFPVLILTGETGPDRMQQDLLQEFPVLHKPVDGARLRHAIHALLAAPPA